MQHNSPQPTLESLFLALSHDKRRAIVHMLALHPATVSQLATSQGLSLPAMHKHMAALEAAQLVQRKKVGRTNFVALNRRSLGLVWEWAMQYRTEWGSDEATLENYVAGLGMAPTTEQD